MQSTLPPNFKQVSDAEGTHKAKVLYTAATAMDAKDQANTKKQSPSEAATAEATTPEAYTQASSAASYTRYTINKGLKAASPDPFNKNDKRPGEYHITV